MAIGRAINECALSGALRHDKLQIATRPEADAERQQSSGRAAAAVAATSSVIERQRMKDGKKKADCAIFASSHQARRQSRGREREKSERERGGERLRLDPHNCGYT